MGTRSVSYAEDEIAELRRSQTGIAAELVDLIRRGFDEHVAAVGGGLGDSRLHHGGMRRAHGVDANGLTGLVPSDRLGKPVDRSQGRHPAHRTSRSPTSTVIGDADATSRRRSTAVSPMARRPAARYSGGRLLLRRRRCLRRARW